MTPSDQPDASPGAQHPAQSDLIGHDAQQTDFIASLGSRLHHAWMLCGPEGIGKATFAYWAAGQILAPADREVGRETRQRIARNTHSALSRIVRPLDARTGKLRATIPVDTVRELGRSAHLSAPDGGWRVVIVDAADDLTLSAANALLKILEEPPERLVFFLITHQPGRQLPTIRSRCRKLAFSQLADEAVGQIVGRQLVLPGPDLDALIALADGSAGRAFALHTGGGLEIEQSLQKLLGAPSKDLKGILALAEHLSRPGQPDQFELAAGLIQHHIAKTAHASVVNGQAGCAVSLSELAATFAVDLERTRALNLDRKHLILNTLSRLSGLRRVKEA